MPENQQQQTSKTNTYRKVSTPTDISQPTPWQDGHWKPATSRDTTKPTPKTRLSTQILTPTDTSQPTPRQDGQWKLLWAETLPNLPPKQDYHRHYQTYPQNKTITDTSKPTPKTRLSTQILGPTDTAQPTPTIRLSMESHQFEEAIPNLSPRHEYQHRWR